ncbi:hypothetical protein QVD17_05552 [Tagetes erecta]|uniref:Leucine-rich repeat-containing N-terminal plant-type domain-containing protein n=1 Tax=Tagetes erecta TaxID=13708 RepID=A0AAD8LE20_TARER|nr:hypothetical protein QVD17_05552 [Tagetes erecta]
MQDALSLSSCIYIYIYINKINVALCQTIKLIKTASISLVMAFSFRRTIFFLYLLVNSTYAASLVSHGEECLALFEFKQSIQHQPYASYNVGGFQKLDSWRKVASNASDNDSDCCLWDGVVCSNDNYVIGLDLSQSSLYGSIKSNSSLFNLVHLQMLNLSMNNFVGSQIPSKIARLKQLRSLVLSDSSFSGQIPIEISHLKQLSLLDLSGNPLKLHSPSLEYLLQNLTRLQELYLSGVDISSTIPSFLGNFSSLRSIGLDGCWLRGKFPSTIFHLPKLKFLSMTENPSLTGSLPEFQNNSFLEYLDLYATRFFGSIPESISRLNHLVILSLQACYFSGCIPRSLSNMTQLAFLGLGQDEHMGLYPFIPSLPSNPGRLEVCEKERMHDWIGKLTNLEALCLVRINIYDEILPALANLTKLTEVVLKYNHIYGHMPSSFMNLTQLRNIELRGNNLQGEILSSFSNFKSLNHLNIMENNFCGRVDLDRFAGLTKIRTLVIGFNRISFVDTNNTTNGTLLPALEEIGLESCNLIKFPSFLRLQNKMTEINLQNNKIEGLVPEWMLNNSQETLLYLNLKNNSITGFHGHPHYIPWVCLKVLKIEYNKLQGHLPIPPVTTVFYDASNNNLTGEIPLRICEVKSLRVLHLSSNNMTGTLPPCLGSFSNFLSHLDLKGNNFHGQMMNAFTHGSKMKRIDLSDNQFTGQLSRSMVNCTNLEVLVLGGNSFDDVFPFWLGTLSKLRVLNLRSNKLHGAIQNIKTIDSQFPELQIIDLSNNGFSGQLPDKFFRTWNAMKSINISKSDDKMFELVNEYGLTIPYLITLTNKGVKREYNYHVLNIFIDIDLSCNNFEGRLPQSLGELHGLEALNLSNNHFTGHVLSSLGNLTNLESLDLSQNELSGEIPHTLLQLGFLEIFNVSFNNLHGSIPQGKQFNTFDKNSYMGNPNLCGEVLQKECQRSKASTVSTTSIESESLMPDDTTDLIIISLGVGIGLLIGIVIGNLLYGRKV